MYQGADMKDDIGYSIVYYGSDVLASAAESVLTFTDDVAELANDMHRVMDRAKGIGLAAPQIGVPLRMVVINLTSVDEGPKITLVNPSIVWDSGDSTLYEEGCLSVPGIYRDVLRPSKVAVKAFSTEGKPFEFEAGGLFARVLQHEIDHLNGILFLDHLDDFVRKELTKELKKIRKMNK